MLLGLDPILTPDLLKHLCAMGHGEWVAVVDANFTAQMLAQGKPLVLLPGLSLERVSRAVLSVFPLDLPEPRPAAYMQVSGAADGHRTPAQAAVAALLQARGVASERFEAVERFAFYDRVKKASLIVQSGEETGYGNVLFSKGVILPA